MLATGTDQFAAVADQSFIGKSAQDSSTAHWNSILGGSNDDAGVCLFQNLHLNCQTQRSPVDRSSALEDRGLQESKRLERVGVSCEIFNG
jgi:hypothetical protein